MEQDGATSRPTLRIAEGACLGTADCSAMDVLREERDESQCGGEEGPGCWLAVTVGIGAEVVRVEV